MGCTGADLASDVVLLPGQDELMYISGATIDFKMWNE